MPAGFKASSASHKPSEYDQILEHTRPEKGVEYIFKGKKLMPSIVNYLQATVMQPVTVHKQREEKCVEVIIFKGSMLTPNKHDQ